MSCEEGDPRKVLDHRGCTESSMLFAEIIGDRSKVSIKYLITRFLERLLMIKNRLWLSL